MRPNKFEGAYVKGGYRGHQLTLKSVGGSTQIVVSMDYSDDKIAASKNDLAVQTDNEKQKSAASLINVGFQVKGQIEAQTNRQKIIYNQTGIEQDIVYLQSIFDLICDLTEVYPKIVAIGGEIVPSLEQIMNTNPGLKPIIIQMIENIEHETKRQWATRSIELICQECLARCVLHNVEISNETLFNTKNYYGCRICGQSQDFLEAKWVVAKLDREMKEDWITVDSILQVNWLKRRALFDFDGVKIERATDEDVERFAVQVGNDTDEVRKVRYQGMECEVFEECRLTENTIRILKHIFGNVAINEIKER